MVISGSPCCLKKIIKSFDQNDPMVAFLNKYKQQVKHKDKLKTLYALHSMKEKMRTLRSD